MRKADSAIGMRNYNVALAKLRAYKICNPESAVKADDKIFQVFKLIEREKKAADIARKEAIKQTTIAIEERNKALRQAESSRLTALALQRAPTNPTVAVRLAELALKVAPDNISAMTVIDDILKDNNTSFYYKTIKVSSEMVQSLDFSPDGNYFLTASDGLITLWKVDGTKIASKKTHDLITELRFIPYLNNYDFIVINGKGVLTRYDMKFQQRFASNVGYFFSEQRVSFDNHLCVVGTLNDHVQVCNIETGAVQEVKIPSQTSDFNPTAVLNGSKIAILYYMGGMGRGRSLYLYDTISKTLNPIIRDPTYQSIYFEKGSGNLIVSQSNGATTIWNCDGKLISKSNGVENYPAFFRKSFFISSSVRVAFAENQQMIHIESNDSILHFSQVLRDDTIYSFAYNPINHICITGNLRGEIKFWTINSMTRGSFTGLGSGLYNEIRVDPKNNSVLLFGQQGSVNILKNGEGSVHTLEGIPGVLQTACFYPNKGSVLVGVAYKSVDIRPGLFDYSTPTLNEYDYSGHGKRAFNIVDDISAITVSGDGEIIVSADGEGFLKRWTKSGQLIDSIFIKDGSVTYLAISSNKAMIAMAVEGEENKVILYLVNTKRKFVLKTSRSFITKMAFSKNDRYLFVGDDFNGLYKFDIVAGKVPAFTDNITNNARGVLSLDVSRDDRYLLVTRKPASSSNTVSFVTVLDAKSGRLVQTIKSDTESAMINSAAFSNDSKFIFTLHKDGVVKKWYTTNAFLNSDRIAVLGSKEKATYDVSTDY